MASVSETLLTREEELALIIECQDETASQRRRDRAFERLLAAFDGWLISLSKRFRVTYGSLNLPLDDLHQAGILGLHLGVQRFNPASGNRLSTVVRWWILSEMQRVLGQAAHIPAGGNLRTIMQHLPLALAEIRSKQPGLTDDEEIQAVADYLDRPVETVRDAMALLGGDASLDAELPGETGLTLGETIADAGPNQHDAVVSGDVHALLRQAVEALPPIYRYIIEQRRLRPVTDRQTLVEVAATLGLDVTKERVRQMEMAAVEALGNKLLGLLYQRASGIGHRQAVEYLLSAYD
jgi:RNA polymerase sigma factor (sigma-70 family)